MCYWLKTLIALSLAAPAACATANGDTGVRQVFVIRHLQAGSGSDPGLTEAGARQAQMLASWFRKKDAPRAIYVTPYRRTQDTAAPLAARLGLRPIRYDPGKPEELIRAVQAGPGNVLVVGHSNTVPDIVERLGGARPEPIAHHEHGDIWRVAVPGGATVKLKLEGR